MIATMNIKQENIQSLLSKHSFRAESEDGIEPLTCILCKKLMVNAYQTYCGCQYCRECIVNYVSNDEIYCCGGKDDCKEEYLVLERNVVSSALLNRKISKVKVFCPNDSCTYVDELNLMESHMHNCPNQSIQCPYLSVGCDQKASKEQISHHLHNEAVPHTRLLLDLIHNLKNELGTLKGSIESITEKCEEKEARIIALEQGNIVKEEETRNLKRKLETFKAEIEEKEERISELEDESEKRTRMDVNYESALDQLEKTSIGTSITFNVDKYTARKTSEECMHSPYFYSHTNGYKLRLSVYPGGKGDGKGTHLSVFLALCVGEYDDVLWWPCQYSFSVSIINQSSGATHKVITMSSKNAMGGHEALFNKPKSSVYLPGFKTFMSHEDLQSTVGLIVNDSIIIKCTVTPPT